MKKSLPVAKGILIIQLKTNNEQEKLLFQSFDRFNDRLNICVINAYFSLNSFNCIFNNGINLFACGILYQVANKYSKFDSFFSIDFYNFFFSRIFSLLFSNKRDDTLQRGTIVRMRGGRVF